MCTRCPCLPAQQRKRLIERQGDSLGPSGRRRSRNLGVGSTHDGEPRLRIGHPEPCAKLGTDFERRARDGPDGPMPSEGKSRASAAGIPCETWRRAANSPATSSARSRRSSARRSAQATARVTLHRAEPGQVHTQKGIHRELQSPGSVSSRPKSALLPHGVVAYAVPIRAEPSDAQHRGGAFDVARIALPFLSNRRESSNCRAAASRFHVRGRSSIPRHRVCPITKACPG
jgi:hypothetical protein